MPDAASANNALGRRRWLILGVIALAQLMVVLDLTVMNIALPSAQRALHFTTVDRQWVVTAYTLAFGSLLLLGGRLADLLGRKVTFLTGLVGFAGVSAIGGASVNFTMLITARAFQGAFAALLVPAALSLLATTFTEPKERGRAFGIYGAVAGAGGALGLLLGGALTEYLSWRWTMYVNLVFAAAAFAGGALLLVRQSSPARPRLDIPGVLLVSGALFCLVYGFSNAASHSWATPSTYGFLAAGAALGVLFAAWQGRTAHPLLPPRVVLDRNRGGAYLSMLIASAGLFGTFGRVRDAGRGGGDGLAGPARLAHRLYLGRARPAHPDRDRPGHGDRAGDQHRHVRRGPPGRGSRLRHRHRRPATRRLGRHLTAEHHLRRRRHLLYRGASRLGPADRPPGPDRAGTGARLRHRVLVDRRHLRRRRGHRRCSAPARATGPEGRALPGTGRSASSTSPAAALNAAPLAFFRPLAARSIRRPGSAPT
jgi:MFS family permease